MFTSSRRSRGGGVRWIEPGRRRRRRMPVMPLAILLLLLAAAGAVGYVLHDRAQQHAELRDAAVRFAKAWEQRKPGRMYRELDADAHSKYSARRFAADYRTADERATVRTGRRQPDRRGARRPRADGGGGAHAAVRHAARPDGAAGHARGRAGRRALAALPAAARPAPRRARAAHDPGDPAPRLGARRRRPAARPRADRGRDRGRAAGRATIPGSGLERAFNDRLAGRPSAVLLFGSRRIAATKARRGRPVRATIRPGLQRAAVAALGDRLGGVAVLRPRDGAVLALSGLATTGPQPPGSTFKIITLAAALQARKASPSSVYPVRTFATLSGVKLRNASDESCGGSLTQSFAHSCNSVFAPLGAKVGRKRMLAAAERFGFNTRPRVPYAVTSQFPADLKDDLAVGAASIGQERDLATPLQMAAVGATIANRGVHPSPRIVRSDPVVRKRAVSRRTAAQVREMMLAVVRGGTGTAAALPGVEVAGKTGTAELRPTAGGPQDPKNTDAWFVAFAPARSPKVAVAVMLVGAGQGGATAAPIARQVLSAAL